MKIKTTPGNEHRKIDSYAINRASELAKEHIEDGQDTIEIQFTMGDYGNQFATLDAVEPVMAVATISRADIAEYEAEDAREREYCKAVNADYDRTTALRTHHAVIGVS